jgi:hypothetical protein
MELSSLDRLGVLNVFMALGQKLNFPGNEAVSFLSVL